MENDNYMDIEPLVDEHTGYELGDMELGSFSFLTLRSLADLPSPIHSRLDFVGR
jgi:hypothetical protein